MMNHTTVTQKYAQPDVVNFWKDLSQTGLQQCEQAMVARYLPRQGHLLDIGCGAGRAVLALSQVGYQVTGIDVSEDMLAAGRSLSREAQLAGADLLRLPFVDDHFDGLFMFFGALQHIPGRASRRRAIAEMARVTRPQGRLILGLDNVAPALACYGYWLAEKFRRQPAAPINGAPQPSAHSHADSTLWSRETRRVNPVLWHARGLARTLRWRTWPGLRDHLRRLSPFHSEAEPGDIQVAQFAIPVTPGRIDYHLYQAEELIEDAATAGCRLLGYHSGTELNENDVYPPTIRGQDKQLFFAFERQTGRQRLHFADL